MMRNKRIVKKRSNKIKFHETLEKKIRMIIKKYLYDSLMLRPIMLRPFPNLVNVTLQNCKFNFLPKEFGTLHHLQEIKLSRNNVVNTTQSAWEWLKQAPVNSNLQLLQIKDYDLSKLPLQITCLKNIRTLNMTGNRIGSLPKEFGNLPLLNLDLSYNNLGRSKQSAWEWLMQTPIRNNLRTLNLKHNYITAIPLQINCLKNLQKLFLSKNKINFLPKQFNILSQLLTLDLFNNLLGTYRHATWLEASTKHNLSFFDIGNNSLTEFPLQITCVKNLRMLDISENKIDFLPKELGTLPHLANLNLAFNYLGRSDRNIWEWLEQTAVRNKLSELYLSENFLTELSPQIGKLNALTVLYLDGNKLKCLPQSLANLKNLEVLNLDDNDLLYLPGCMAHLSVDIDVEDNPFDLKDNSDLITNSEVPSLMECSADVILKSGLNYTNHQDIVLPQTLVRYLNTAKYCFFCETPCFRYYGKRFLNCSDYYYVSDFEFNGSRNIWNAKFECYACSFECAEELRI